MTTKAVPEKGYVRADFVIERSEFGNIRYLRRAHSASVHAYVDGSGWVCFSPWLWKNAGAGMKQELVALLRRGYVGEVPGVWMFPSAFPKVYGYLHPREEVA